VSQRLDGIALHRLESDTDDARAIEWQLALSVGEP
jgi:hypothetical protein